MANIYFYDIEVAPNFFSNIIKRKSDGKVFQYVYHQSRKDDLGKMLGRFYTNPVWQVGYNSSHFDDRVIEWMRRNLSSLDNVANETYKFAQKVINDETKAFKWGDGVQFNSIDLMRVGYLDKSLKMVAVNLEWPLIQDLPYEHDHHVQTDEVQEILDYNLNDVEITERLYEELHRDIKLRQHMSQKYGENLMSDSNSGIANKLLNKMYAEASGQSYWDFKDQRTYRDEINLGNLIADKLEFNHPNIQELIDKLHNTTLESDDNNNFESFEYHVEVGDTRYKIARGGIHSENDYELYEATDEYTFVELDFSSFYPYIMNVLGIKPEHVDKSFLEEFKSITNARLENKYAGNKVESNAQKLVINSVYGKMGSERHWLYDPKAMYSVTINGQLFMLKMIELMEENDFPCVYSNTDGCVFKVERNRKSYFEGLAQSFEEWTNFVLDEEEFTKLLIRDVNNLIWEKKDGGRKRNGDLNKNKHTGSWGIMRSFDKPVVAEAIENYFFEDKPVEETIEEKDSPMDFCMAQKAGKKFDVVRRTIEDGELKTEKIQRTNRYFISDTKGDSILKKTENKEISMAGTSGEHILLYNEEDQYPRDRVKDSYYEKEAMKIIKPFINKQQTLF